MCAGEGDLEEGNDFQMDIPQNLWKSSVQIEESDDVLTKESSSASPHVDPGLWNLTECCIMIRKLSLDSFSVRHIIYGDGKFFPSLWGKHFHFDSNWKVCYSLL